MSQQPNDPAARDGNDELVCIYDKLRTEILHNDTTSFQLLGYSVTLVAVAMGFAFQLPQQSVLKLAVFLANIFLLFIGMYQILERLGGTFLIATYLREFVEPNTKHFKWEDRLQKYRTTPGNRGINIFRTKFGVNIFESHVVTYVIVAFANLLLIFFYVFRERGKQLSKTMLLKFPLFNHENERYNFVSFILILGIVLWVVMAIHGWMRYRKYVIHNDKTFGEKWRTIKKAPSETPLPPPPATSLPADPSPVPETP